MEHVGIFKKFKRIIGSLNKLEDWFPNGKNSIRVRLISGSDFIFTYNSDDDWSVETVESYLRKLRGGHKMNVGLHDNSNECN